MSGNGALVELARAQFRHAVQLPGRTAPGQLPNYPRSDDIVLSARLPVDKGMLKRDRYLLHRDLRTGDVLVEHPESHEVERISSGLVKQIRYMAELPTELPR